MFFNECRAKCDGGNGSGVALRMIRKSDRIRRKFFAQSDDVAQVDRLHSRRINGDTVQENHLFRPCRLQCMHGTADLLHRPHPRREHERYLLRPDVGEKIEMIELH